MIIIGICGASGSGKSTLSRELCEKLIGKCLLITQDCYYRDNAALPFEERARVNYDEPAAFDHELLLEDMLALRRGAPITKKSYDYVNHCRADSDDLVYPREVLVFEGIHAFYDPKLRDIIDLKLFMHVEPDICLLRRVKRDINKRGRHIDGIAMQYLETVKPMFDMYIKGYIEHADIVVPGGGKGKKLTDVLAKYINNL